MVKGLLKNRGNNKGRITYDCINITSYFFPVKFMSELQHQQKKIENG